MRHQNLPLAGHRLKRIADTALTDDRFGQSRIVDQALKRAFDFSVALLCLFLLLPLFALVAAAIWAVDRGSPFYSHRRLGRDGKAFGCLKFRSMRLDGDEILRRHLAANPAAREEWEQTHKLKDDPRITLVGQLLRKSSLDELPQLINIVRGEMSLVGPRPIVQAEVEKYGDAASAYFSVRPGLTGMWQVSGRSDTSYAERVRLDRQYVESRSFAGDMVIILRTVPAVFLVKGSY